jgi:hypothetical protein
MRAQERTPRKPVGNGSDRSSTYRWNAVIQTLPVIVGRIAGRPPTGDAANDPDELGAEQRFVHQPLAGFDLAARVHHREARATAAAAGRAVEAPGETTTALARACRPPPRGPAP